MPENMIEYSLSKLSGENMCSALMKNNNKIKIFKPRLPRLETDQTVSILPVNNNNTVEYILECLRKYNSFRKR